MRVSASLRGYAMLSRARNAIYPRWGLGTELGLGLRPGAMDLFAPSAFVYLYGYVPGIMDTHGIRLTALRLGRLDGRMPESNVNSLPRGMADVAGLRAYILSNYGSQTKFTADYAMPLLPLDWTFLGPVAYIRNLELTLHADADILSGPLGIVEGSDGGSRIVRRASGPAELLYSAGADLVVRLANFLWVPYDTRIGVSYNYRGSTIPGATFDAKDIDFSPHSVELVFSVDLP
jgi:hypothetical protein